MFYDIDITYDFTCNKTGILHQDSEANIMVNDKYQVAEKIDWFINRSDLAKGNHVSIKSITVIQV